MRRRAVLLFNEWNKKGFFSLSFVLLIVFLILTGIIIYNTGIVGTIMLILIVGGVFCWLWLKFLVRKEDSW
jgi:hypothetical protein